MAIVNKDSSHKGSSLFENFETGVVFQNPQPHLQSVHAYFPSVAFLPNGNMLALYSVGEAFEAVNLRIQISRSFDGGHTWHSEGPLRPI